jgi:signal transduction histidine kinase
VTAREEERRRLRRDLHDGLGPRLAAQTLKIGSARSLYPQDPAAADALLAGLESDIEAALTDIRRLVYDLRPPALDELGLVGAVREAAAQYGENGLSTSIQAPERLPLLPAAVEVAAYRIVQEALTNVVRHARAGSCLVRLSPGDVLELEITDDGVGLPADRRAGVGLSSMRERAAELGGTCVIEPAPSRGARVLARLPLPKRDKPTDAQADDDGSLKDRA